MDLEVQLLSHLVDNGSMKIAWGLGLKTDHFIEHKGVFNFVSEYWLREAMIKVPTPEVLLYEFPSLRLSPPEESLVWLVEKLKERFTFNQLQITLKSAAQNSDNPQAAVRDLYTQSWDVLSRITPRYNRTDMSQDVVERQGRYIERTITAGRVRGIPLGFDLIDQHTNGLNPGELAAVVGSPKVGKSHALCNALIAQRRAGYTPYLCTMELSVEDMEDRIDAHISGLSYEKIYKGELAPDQFMELKIAQEEFASLGPVYVEKPPSGERTVQYIVNRARELGANSLLIDQLSFMEPGKHHREKHDQITEIMFNLKSEISQDEASLIPVFLAVQFNREAMKVQRGRGGLQHIALSSSVEQTVDIAYGLFQSKEMRTSNSLVLDIMGSRRTAPGSWLLEWDFNDRTSLGVRRRYDDD